LIYINIKYLDYLKAYKQALSSLRCGFYLYQPRIKFLDQFWAKITKFTSQFWL